MRSIEVALAVFAVAVASGCPGKRRPPPDVGPAPAPTASERPGSGAPGEATPRPTSHAGPADEAADPSALARRRAEVEELRRAFLAEPDDRGRWERAMAALADFEDACFTALDQAADAEEAARAEDLYAEAQVIRDELARREPPAD